MAENTIDNLSIEISGSADRLSASLDRLEGVLARLATAADRVRTATENVGDGMHDAADDTEDMGDATEEAGEQAVRARRNLGGFWNAVRGVSAQIGGGFVRAIRGGIGVVGSFIRGFARIALFRVYRTLVKDLGQSFKDLYGWSDMFGNSFANSMDKITTAAKYLGNSIAAMTAPLINALAPALDFIIDKIVDVLNWFNQLFAVLAGQDTYVIAKKVAVSFGDAIDTTTNNSKKKINELKRTILGFDEINKLQAPNNNSGSGSGSSPYSTGYETMFEEKELSGGFKGFSNAIENALSDTLSRIGLIVSGASLAVGAILAFGGANVPLGLSLMAAGASGLVSIIGMNWDGLSADVKLVIGAIETAVGGALLGIGAVMAFSGVNVALGIAMMAAGAASLAAAVGLNWDFITGKVSASAKGVVGAISAASIALGAILTFTGANVPLGVGLLAAGVTGAAATLSWDWLKDKLTGKVATITSIVSGALLALGAVLTFSGAAIPLGLGMMAAGAVGLAATVTANWNVITDKLRGPIGVITGIISGASLVLGILAIVAGNIPLGLGLILAGAAGLASTVSANWDGFKEIGKTAIEKVKEGWETIKSLAVTAVVSLVKNVGEWAGDAWEAIKSGSTTIVKTITTAVEKAGTWVADAWTAVKMGAGTVTRTVLGAINKAGTWVADAWTAVKMGAGTVTRTVLGAINKAGTWVADAWTAVKMGAGTVTRTVLGAINKAGTWVADAWTAVKMGAGTVTRTVLGAINKAGTWVADAWTAVKMGAGTVTRTVLGAINKASTWVADAWTAAKMGAGTIKKTIETALTKGKWLNDVWDFIDSGSKIVKNLVLNILPATDNSWLGGLLGINSREEVDKIIEEDAAMLKHAQKQAQENGIKIPVDLEPEWNEAFGGVTGYLGVDNLHTDITAGAVKGWKGSYKKEVGADDTSTTITANLSKTWEKQKPLDYLGLSGLTAVIKTKLQKEKNNAVSYKINAGGGTGKGVVAYELKRRGGVFSNGQWSNLPQYANGTLNAGTIFAAGEAGPEIVGHVGGRTEVLNKSQLASAMYSAVQAAMAPAAANFAAAAQSMSVADVSFDLETLAEMVRQGVEQAMGRQNELDRQRNEYLRQINEKDYNPEISTSSINKAQQRMNRRAGTTIVPVGT